MKLIFGLGNPGKKYEKTRHNVGFVILDSVAKKSEVTFKLDQARQAEIAEIEKNKLVKPQTFMNNSGQAASLVKNFWKVMNNDIIVLHDEVDLEFGKVRIQKSGSSAGHKGIQSIIDAIGENFWRIRVGVGKNDIIDTESWVLMNFPESDQERLKYIVDKTAELVIEFLGNEIKEQTLNFTNYNGA